MRKSYAPGLAAEGIRKNRKIYFPYYLTSVLLVAVTYIISSLASSDIVEGMGGGGTLQAILTFGFYVIVMFSAIFLFYTNSFLIRRRKKEFGLYSILGMNKGNIGHILFWETLISYAITVISGLVIGIAFSKLAELMLANIIGRDITFAFYLNPEIIFLTAGAFLVIHILIMINSMRQIQFASAIELVKSESFGEKPPKSNYLLGIIGLVLLAGAYYLAVSIQQPLSAMFFFFIAVIMVIAATYLLFISGSVIFCRMLQKNEAYYYKKEHFISVSSMVYRMKRNGAGLASICILLTMTLVVISSTAALYFSADSCLMARNPRDICVFMNHYNYYDNEREIMGEMEEALRSRLPEEELKEENLITYGEYCITGRLQSSNVKLNLNSETNQAFIDYEEVAEVHFMDLAGYNRVYGKEEKLRPGEAIVFMTRTCDVGEVLTVGEQSFTVKKLMTDGYIFDSYAQGSVGSSLFVIVPDMMEVAEKFKEKTDYDGSHMLLARWYFLFDTALDREKQQELTAVMEKDLHAIFEKHSMHGDDGLNIAVTSRANEKHDYVDTFGGLFFVALILGIIFMTSAVLIIYYKQLSEGYEDQSRFGIMQKVGMTGEDIRKTINSQMLTVFLLPIGFAALHTAFAFPMVNRLLMLFGLFDIKPLLINSGISVAVIALIYVVVYKVTSNTYYSIVADRTGKRSIFLFANRP